MVSFNFRKKTVPVGDYSGELLCKPTAKRRFENKSSTSANNSSCISDVHNTGRSFYFVENRKRTDNTVIGKLDFNTLATRNSIRIYDSIAIQIISRIITFYSENVFFPLPTR